MIVPVLYQPSLMSSEADVPLVTGAVSSMCELWAVTQGLFSAEPAVPEQEANFLPRFRTSKVPPPQVGLDGVSSRAVLNVTHLIIRDSKRNIEKPAEKRGEILVKGGVRYCICTFQLSKILLTYNKVE